MPQCHADCWATQRLQRLVAVSRCSDSVQPCADAVYLPNELLALALYARMQLCGEQKLRKPSKPAELAACKTLASKQASEDVVGGVNKLRRRHKRPR